MRSLCANECGRDISISFCLCLSARWLALRLSLMLMLMPTCPYWTQQSKHKKNARFWYSFNMRLFFYRGMSFFYAHLANYHFSLRLCHSVLAMLSCPPWWKKKNIQPRSQGPLAIEGGRDRILGTRKKSAAVKYSLNNRKLGRRKTQALLQVIFINGERKEYFSRLFIIAAFDFSDKLFIISCCLSMRKL